MGAIGWIWAWLMLLGGVRAHLAQSLPAELVGAMMVSGFVALPLLWSPSNGLFGGYAPSALVRGGIAVLALVIGGISRPDAVMGLIAA
jgi:hypothetical protein